MRHYVEPSTAAVDGILWQKDEVELIRGKRVNARILIIIFAIIGAVLVAGFLGIGIINRADSYNNHHHDLFCYTYTGDRYYDAASDAYYFSAYDIANAKYGYNYDAEQLENDPDFEKDCWYGDSATEYIFDGFFDEALLPCLAIYAGWMLIAVLIWLILSRCEMVVTNYRVCGRAWFGRRVDLPLDSITATGTVRWLRRVSVSTASGWISFGFIRNSHQVFSVITQTVIGRQRIKAGAAEPAAPTTVTVEEG